MKKIDRQYGVTLGYLHFKYKGICQKCGKKTHINKEKNYHYCARRLFIKPGIWSEENAILVCNECFG